MWKLVNDWQQRLSSSYALVNGKPFYIDHVNIHDSEDGCCTMEDIQLSGYFLDNRGEEYTRINMSDNAENVDFTYNPIGYANFEGDCFYIRRKPSRYYKYTATRRSLAPAGMGRGVLERCLLEIQDNDYPSYAQAKDWINNGWRRVAFSRDFAITSNGKLLYKGMEAGTYTNRGGISLLNNFKQLEEKLEVGDETVR